MSSINACIRSDDPRGRAVSNFSPHSFTLDDVWCKTVEGFIQGIKFPPADPLRNAIFEMAGLPAWKMRVRAKGEYVWWNGKVIPYRSPEHTDLIRRAIEAKFDQNPDALRALRETRGLEIVHEPGVQESEMTSLPGDVYCKILTNIRK